MLGPMLDYYKNKKKKGQSCGVSNGGGSGGGGCTHYLTSFPKKVLVSSSVKGRIWERRRGGNTGLKRGREGEREGGKGRERKGPRGFRTHFLIRQYTHALDSTGGAGILLDMWSVCVEGGNR